MSAHSSLRNKRIMKPIFRIRDWLMRKSGLFKLKTTIKRDRFYAKIRREDAERKEKIAKKIYEMPSGLIDKKIDNGEIIVSLTSYGHRVTEMLPYMLYSMLTQTVLPHKIAVFLDYDNWNDTILPPLLKEMQRIGVDFYYCEDLKSYKKLIPALQMFPENPILVCDDDFYYHKNYVEWMTEAYIDSDKKTVIGSWGKLPLKKDGQYLPFTEWIDCKYSKGENESSTLFGSGNGTLFPCHVFDGEIQNKNVFMKLCPTADDIWFWAMMERQKVNRVYLKQLRGYGIHGLVERLDDIDVNADTLSKINVIQGANNRQLKLLLDYYKLS